MNTMYAKVTLQMQRVHYWAKAKNFLKHPHRHVFHVAVWVQQLHNDRDIEYLQFKADLEHALCYLIPEQSEMSCESMAEIIKTHVETNFPDRKVKVEVNEDGENGALVE
jgi:hypothetical protein